MGHIERCDECRAYKMGRDYLGSLAISVGLSPETRHYIVTENERLVAYTRGIKCAVFQRAKVSARRMFQQALER